MRPFWFVARSIAGLTLAGLLLVALPVVGSMVSAIVHVDRIAQTGSDAAARASEAMQLARAIVEHLVDMERAGAQYSVLGDERLRRSYYIRRDQMSDAVNRLVALELSPEQNTDAALLLEKEQVLSDALDEWSSGRVVAARKELGSIAERVLERSRQHLDATFEASAQAAVDLRRRLSWQLGTALPLTLLLVAFATRLITRPLAGLGSAIEALERDDFEQPIAISGPSDVRRLGEALDALRLRIRSLEKQKLTFVRRISHELKTPLTTIRQGAELLADRRGTSLAQTVEIADLLRESSLELQKLIEDLLEYGRTQRLAVQSLVFEAVDMNRIVERALSERALALSAKQLVLRTTIGRAVVGGDAKQLRTVVNNLLDNAIKFTPPGGTIMVALAEHEGQARFEVIDTGPGVPKADRDKVFEPFYQGHPQAPGPVKGTGLGLAIARDHVVAHDGRIEILDCPSGAHFRVCLPLFQARS